MRSYAERKAEYYNEGTQSEVSCMSDDIHVMPVNDLMEHTNDDSECPCKPKVIVEGANLIYVHNSWDKRELTEQARLVV